MIRRTQLYDIFLPVLFSDFRERDIYKFKARDVREVKVISLL
jgi:hypothetical protein